MKILFITKPFFIEPLGLMYLSSAARARGHKTQLITTRENLEHKVLEYEPDVIGYSVMTGDHNYFRDLNNSLKQKYRFLSIFGGPHPTFFPEFIREEGVDIVCRGEGELALAKLLDNLQDNKPIQQIPNLCFKANGQVKINPLNHLSNVDDIVFPDRDLVFTDPKIRDGPIKHFIASRGCPFACSYCFNERFAELYRGKGQRVRFRDVSSIVDEVEEVVNSSPTRFIYFQDDTFTLNRNWLNRFAAEYSERIGLPFHCHVRPNTVDEEEVKFLRLAGCYSVHIAVETANDRLRNEILNRRISKKQIIAATEMLRQNNIHLMLQNMIGLPTGSLKDDLDTLELNIRCNPDYSWVSIYQPYPGTALGEFCRREKIYTGDFSDLGSSFFDSSRLDFPDEYKRQLSHLQKLFAIFVEHPELHRLGLSRAMINAPHDKSTKESYQEAYKKFREKGDERLYGFKL